MPLKKWVNSLLFQKSVIFTFFLALPFFISAQRTKKLWLDEIPIKSYSHGIPAVVPKTNQGGGALRIAGVKYEHGIGVASTSILSFQISGKAMSFHALVGVDDEGSKSLEHRFYVIADKKILFESSAMKIGDKALPVNVDLRGVNRLGLLVLVEDEGHNKVYSNWADARFEWQGDGIPDHVPNDGE
jgi:alpha-galactosidase